MHAVCLSLVINMWLINVIDLTLSPSEKASYILFYSAGFIVIKMALY